jgi:uncharacterized membrane protein
MPASLPFAVSLYLVVEALHIIAVLAAFGLPLSAPFWLPYVRRAHPRALPAVHDMQHRVNQRLTAPGTVLILVFGAYMASKNDLWGEVWVDVPIAILVIIGGLGGAFVAPATGRLAALAQADVEAGDGSAVSFGPEYETLYRRYMAAEVFLGVLVLVAVFFMAAKPFA